MVADIVTIANSIEPYYIAFKSDGSYFISLSSGNVAYVDTYGLWLRDLAFNQAIVTNII